MYRGVNVIVIHHRIGCRAHTHTDIQTHARTHGNASLDFTENLKLNKYFCLLITSFNLLQTLSCYQSIDSRQPTTANLKIKVTCRNGMFSENVLSKCSMLMQMPKNIMSYLKWQLIAWKNTSIHYVEILFDFMFSRRRCRSSRKTRPRLLHLRATSLKMVFSRFRSYDRKINMKAALDLRLLFNEPAK